MTAGRGAVAALLACSLLFVSLAPLPAGAEQIRIADASFAEENVVLTRGETAFLWRSAPVRLAVDVVTGRGDGRGHYEVCLASRAPPNGCAS